MNALSFILLPTGGFNLTRFKERLREEFRKGIEEAKRQKKLWLNVIIIRRAFQLSQNLLVNVV